MKMMFSGVLVLTLLVTPPVLSGQQETSDPFGNRTQDFGGIRTFLRAPYVVDLENLDADIAVIGVPVDGGTSNRPGARYGPRDIREASLIYGWARENGFYYMDTGETALSDVTWADLGDVDVWPHDPARTSAHITEAVSEVLERDAFPLVLGGDHSISFPVLRAHRGPSIMLVHLDAHLDSYGPIDPDRMSHGGWVSQVATNLPQVTSIVQIGMRGLANDATGVANSRRYGAEILTSESIHRNGVGWALSQIPEAEAIYMSIDIDVLDPSLAPGTGTVEVGGLTFHQLRDLLGGVAEKGPLVGLDLVEVNSFFDPTGVTAQTAARLVIDALAAGFLRSGAR